MTKAKGLNVKKKTVNIRKKQPKKNKNDNFVNKNKENDMSNNKQDSTLSVGKVAVDVNAWKPFSKPVRKINTSTK